MNGNQIQKQNIGVDNITLFSAWEMKKFLGFDVIYDVTFNGWSLFI